MEKVSVSKKKKGNFFEEKVKEYKELPKKTRSIINLWVAIVIIIILIIVICSINNHHLRNYEKIENNLQKAAIKYSEKNELEGIDSQKVKIDMEVLIKDKYLKIDKKYNKKCIGYALVYTNRDDEVKSKGYIYCKGYATDGFSFE